MPDRSRDSTLGASGKSKEEPQILGDLHQLSLPPRPEESGPSAAADRHAPWLPRSSRGRRSSTPPPTHPAKGGKNPDAGARTPGARGIPLLHPSDTGEGSLLRRDPRGSLKRLLPPEPEGGNLHHRSIDKGICRRKLGPGKLEGNPPAGIGKDPHPQAEKDKKPVEEELLARDGRL